MKSARPRNHARHDLEQPDGAQTLVWTRRGRVRLAVLGSSVVLAAGAFAGCGAATDGSRVASANGQGSQGSQGNQPQQGQGGQGGQGQGGQGQGGQPPQQGGQPTADQR